MRLITARGIGEGMRDNMLGQLVRALPQWDHVELPWSASYGPFNPERNPFGEAFSDALGSGAAKLRAELDKGPAVLVGYSGGAALVGNVAAELHPNIRAVGLVADPFQPGVERFGIGGARYITQKVPIRWIGNPKDAICNCDVDSPLRTLADQSAAMSLGDPVAWGRDVLDRLSRDRWQRVRLEWWNLPGVLRQYAQAVDDVHGYLGLDRLSEHTVYNWRRGPSGDTDLHDLAVWLRRAVE